MVCRNLQSVGYEKDNEIKCGVIFNPIMNELFCAEKGKVLILIIIGIRVSNKKKLKDALVASYWAKTCE